MEFPASELQDIIVDENSKDVVVYNLQECIRFSEYSNPMLEYLAMIKEKKTDGTVSPVFNVSVFRRQGFTPDLLLNKLHYQSDDPSKAPPSLKEFLGENF